MANLFDVSDFALFTQFQDKTQAEAPEGQSKLRALYDKLGLIIQEIQALGYYTEIKRNPLIQGGKSTFKYCQYHWSKVYPKEQNLYNGCYGKVFFVIGTSEEGVDIHIDSNERNGFYSKDHKIAQDIKDGTWWQIPPKEAVQYSVKDYASMVDKYIKENWMQFNQFGKEFNIIECIDELNKMDIGNITKVLLGNYNLILTGAPGTGKTYLAKEIAKNLGATERTCKLVQFHPSYDYTDFVEGLRPIKEGSTLGFQRKDGVFKTFCKEALKNNLDIESALRAFNTDLKKKGSLIIKSHKSSTTFEVKITDKNYKVFPSSIGYPKDGYDCSFDAVRKYLATGEYIEGHQTYQPSIGEYIKEHYMNKLPYVFIIDEINRGEISKIFGELFYSIDSGYRGIKGRVNTQYQNLVPKDDVFYDGFYIPENVYIIGTMNDIDRSVESMDFAMRRRFAWKEITAKSRQSMLNDDMAWDGSKPEQEVIEEIMVRMDNLNACIIDQYGDEELSSKDKIGLTKAYQIGASYFLKYGLYGNFDDLWTNHLEGVLYEYLRGTTNIESKLERLHTAYNDIVAH